WRICPSRGASRSAVDVLELNEGHRDVLAHLAGRPHGPDARWYARRSGAPTTAASRPTAQVPQSSPRRGPPSTPGLEHVLATAHGRRRRSSLEDVMVDIRVSVADGSGADGLVLHLVRRFDWSSISVDETRREVVVSSD